jgi:hypothetical protein
MRQSSDALILQGAAVAEVYRYLNFKIHSVTFKYSNARGTNATASDEIF